MIKVECIMGQFTLIDGEFVEGDDALRQVYHLVLAVDLYVWEGPVDYAIADRMCRDLVDGYRILDSNYEEPEERVVY